MFIIVNFIIIIIVLTNHPIIFIVILHLSFFLSQISIFQVIFDQINHIFAIIYFFQENKILNILEFYLKIYHHLASFNYL